MSTLGGGVVTRAIWEPLKSVPAGMAATEARQILAARGFDIAGVQESANERAIGFVVAQELEAETVSNYLKAFDADRLISDSTPVPELLAVLRHLEHAFVLVGSRVRGIVTRSDLNKPPIRVYLFGLISLLEMHLQFWVSNNYTGEEWENLLAEGRLAPARELCVERQRRDEEVTLLDCVQFCDKASLVISSPGMITRLGLSSKKKATSLLGRAERLRNNLAHSQLDLVQGTTWEKLIDLVEAIQALVYRSDDMIEEDVRGLRERDAEEMWVAG
jgi:hypothetical protein